MYVDVKPVVKIVVSMDLHAMGGGYYLRGATIVYKCCILGGYFEGTTKQSGHLFEEGRYDTYLSTCMGLLSLGNHQKL